MKKLLIILCLIFLALPALAEYKPIPPERSAEYKAEIQNIIDIEYIPAKNKINNISMEAFKIYNKHISHAISKTSSRNTLIQLQQLEYNIDVPIFDILLKLIKITNKYVNITNDIPSTGYYIELWEFMQPYFDNYNIDTKNINSLSNQASIEAETIEKYCIYVSKFNR